MLPQARFLTPARRANFYRGIGQRAAGTGDAQKYEDTHGELCLTKKKMWNQNSL